MGDPGTSPCTCLNTRRTSSSLITCNTKRSGNAGEMDKKDSCPCRGLHDTVNFSSKGRQLKIPAGG
jgi:hypothetical protein